MMMTTRRSLATLLLALCSLSIAFAQTPPETQLPRVTEQTIDTPLLGKEPLTAPSIVIVTATASSQRVRYVSMGEVHQSRLQVFSVDGTQVFDSSFRLGNLIDWHLRDQQGAQLADSSYLFLVTVRDFSNNLTQKYGTAQIEQEQVALQQISRDELPEAQSTALAAHQLSAGLSPVDRIAAAGINRTTTTSPTGHPTTGTEPAGTSAAGATTVTGENATGTGTQNKIAKWIDNAGTLGDSTIFEDATGKVGINTINPALTLDVNGAGRIGQLVLSRGFAAAGKGGYLFAGTGGPGPLDAEMGFFLANDGTNGGSNEGPYFIGRGNNFSRIGAQRGSLFFFGGSSLVNPVLGEGELRFFTNGAERLTVAHGGNVGIGTTAPLVNLQVQGSGYVEAKIKSINERAILSLDSTIGGLNRVWTLESGVFGNAGLFGIYDRTTQQARLVIDPAGNVGIGTTSPRAKLDVDSPNGTAVYGSSISGSSVYGYSTSGVGVLGVTSAGTGVYGSSTSSSGYAGYFAGKARVTGHLDVESCTGCTISSDQNLKANFSTISPRSVLDRLAALPIRAWNYKSDAPSVRHVGPMAQDFRAAFNLGADDLHIDMIDANGVTMAAIQGLYQQNKELLAEVRQQNKELMRKVERLQTQLNQVKRTIRSKHAAKR